MPTTGAPRVLVLGATGRIGTAVVRTLEATPGQVVPVRASRSKATVEQWIKEERRRSESISMTPAPFPARWRASTGPSS